MGLDQYFLTTKNYDDNEIIYFRKYHKLDNFIRERLDFKENGGLIRLLDIDIQAIRDFIIEDAKDNFMFENYESNGAPYNDEFYRIIGILTYHLFTQKPLYYGSDW